MQETELSILKEIRDLLKSKVEAPVSTRFVKNSDSSVLDKSTGLVWGPTFEKEMDFADAEKACREFNLGGHNNWRLPIVKELISLIDYDKRDPAINKDFYLDTKSSWYWSSTPFAGYSSSAWIVDFGSGSVSYGSKGVANYVRPVRSSQ